jgi:hypothetical protein
MEHRSTASIESDIATIRKFAWSYRAYWGVTSDGAEREPVGDRVGLRHRLHRQLPAVEQTPGSDRDVDPALEGDDAAVGKASVQVQEVDRPCPGMGPVRTFLQGMKVAWRDARAARRGGLRGAIERGVAVAAGIATIIATIIGMLGAIFGWWNP